MNEVKKFPKWLKILLGVVPVVLIVGVLVFGDGLIGGQGFLRKDIISKPSVKKDIVKPVSDIIPTVVPTVVLTGGELVQVNPSLDSQINNGGKEVMLGAALKNSLDGELTVKTLDLTGYGKGSCEKIINCVSDISLLYENLTYHGVLTASNSVNFPGSLIKLGKGERKDLKFMVTLLNHPPSLGVDTILYFALEGGKITAYDQNAGKVVINGNVKGNAYTVLYNTVTSVNDNTLPLPPVNDNTLTLVDPNILTPVDPNLVNVIQTGGSLVQLNPSLDSQINNGGKEVMLGAALKNLLDGSLIVTSLDLTGYGKGSCVKLINCVSGIYLNYGNINYPGVLTASNYVNFPGLTIKLGKGEQKDLKFVVSLLNHPPSLGVDTILYFALGGGKVNAFDENGGKVVINGGVKGNAYTVLYN